MKVYKSVFQDNLIKWENHFEQYKNSYPNNFGMMFRKHLAAFLMLVSVLLFLDSFTGLEVLSMVPCFVSPMLFFFAFVMWLKTRKTFVYTAYDTAALEKEIADAESIYSEYPDTKEYLSKLKSSFMAEKRRKRVIKNVFWTCYIGVLLIYGGSVFFNVQNKDGNLFGEDLYCQALALDEDKPFLRIKPLKTDVSGDLKVESNYIDLYLSFEEYNLSFEENNATIYGPYRMFRFLKPKLANYEGNELLRLSITDEEGTPIVGCPSSVFWANDHNVLYSNYFPPYAYSSSSHYDALHTLKYLQDHKDGLRFLVEKIN